LGLATVPFPCTDFDIALRALNALDVHFMLLTTKTVEKLARVRSHWVDPLTARDNNPKEIHHEVVAPEIVSLRSAVGQVLVVMVKHGCRIVEHVAIDLAQ
jgi:hypothetical protein